MFKTHRFPHLALLATLSVTGTLEAGLIAHWKLDDGNGTVAADSAVGGSNNGTLNNSPTWLSGTDAKVGGALDFNATGTVTAAVANLPVGSSSRTISLWLYADASITDQKFFAYGATGAGSEGKSFSFTLEDNSGNPTIFFRHSGGNYRYSGQSVTLSQWNHVAIVVPTGTTMTSGVLVYLNGSPVSGAQGDGSARPLDTGTSEVTLGGDITGAAGAGFDGRLDDVQIYDSALSGVEIAALYNNPGSVIADTTRPDLLSKNPADNATGASINISPTAIFSETIALENGGIITIRNLADGSGASDEIITLPDSRVTAGGASLSINPANPLTATTSYAIRISDDAVKDLAGNFFPGIDNDTDWSFITGTVPPPTPPNVLFVVFDDLNTWIEPIGEYPDVLTPNMNRLAATGVTFKRAYCQAPICGPSRVSFLTGLRPSTTGQYALGSRLSGVGAHKSLHESFKDADYTTASIGKVYHNGADFGSWLDLGNGSHNYGPLPASKLTSAAVSGSVRLVDWGAYPANDTQLEDYGFVTWARDRIEEFAASPATPFFMSVGMTQPHVPLFAPQKWFDLYPVSPQRSFARPFYEADDLDDTPRFARYLHWNLPEPRTETLIQHNEWDNHTRAYLACVSYADMNLGRLLDGLDDPNGDGNTSDSIRDNTIVVILSDHGYHLGEKGLTAKTTLWDRATHVPVIISAPGMAEGQICTQPLELLDLYPTLLDLCGLAPYSALEGITLRPQLEDPTGAPARRPAITTHGPNSHSIVDERYRYTRYADGSEELYDHAIDKNEATNRIDDPNFREVAARLASFLPTVNAPNASGTTRIAEIGSNDVISWQGSPINDTELGLNPAVANYAEPVADEAVEDIDGDLMPDWWERHYTGSIDILQSGGNNDGDPVPDALEYLHGTDPTDRLNFFRVTAEPDTSGGITVKHPTVPGRNYRFLTSLNLSDWTSQGIPAPGSGTDITSSFTSLGLPATKGFIRVEVRSDDE